MVTSLSQSLEWPEVIDHLGEVIDHLRQLIDMDGALIAEDAVEIVHEGAPILLDAPRIAALPRLIAAEVSSIAPSALLRVRGPFVDRADVEHEP